MSHLIAAILAAATLAVAFLAAIFQYWAFSKEPQGDAYGWRVFSWSHYAAGYLAAFAVGLSVAAYVCGKLTPLTLTTLVLIGVSFVTARIMTVCDPSKKIWPWGYLVAWGGVICLFVAMVFALFFI